MHRAESKTPAARLDQVLPTMQSGTRRLMVIGKHLKLGPTLTVPRPEPMAPASTTGVLPLSASRGVSKAKGPPPRQKKGKAIGWSGGRTVPGGGPWAAAEAVRPEAERTTRVRGRST